MLDFYKSGLFIHIFILTFRREIFLEYVFDIDSVDISNLLIIKDIILWVKIFTICGGFSV